MTHYERALARFIKSYPPLTASEREAAKKAFDDTHAA